MTLVFKKEQMSRAAGLMSTESTAALADRDWSADVDRVGAKMTVVAAAALTGHLLHVHS